MSSSASYETDFLIWTQEQSALLRAGAWAEIDQAHIAEELEEQDAEQSILPMVEAAWLPCLEIGEQPGFEGTVQGRGRVFGGAQPGGVACPVWA